MQIKFSECYNLELDITEDEITIANCATALDPSRRPPTASC